MKKLLLSTAMLSALLAFGEEPKLILERDPTLLTTTIQVSFLSGSLQDPAGKKGVANLLAQVLLRGTRNRSREVFQGELEKLGATISASASHDSIRFNMEVIQENTQKLFLLLEDALIRPAFDKKEFDQLKREVTDRIQFIKNSNGSLASLALRKHLYAGTALELSDFGTLSTIKSIGLPDLVKYYNQHFTKGNVLFGIASPIEEAKLKKPLTKIFSQLPPGVRSPTVKVDIAKQPKSKIILVDKGGTETGTIVMGQKGIVAQEEARYALGVGDFSFGGEALIARLFRVVRSELGWTYSIRSSFGVVTPSFQPSAYTIASTPSVEFSSKALLKQIEMWKEYYQDGLNKAEIKLAQESLINSYPFHFATADGRLSMRLFSEIYGVPVLSPAEYEKTILAIDNKQILKALAEKHTEDGWTIVVVADSKTFLPQLAEAQKGLDEKEVLKVEHTLLPEAVIR
jgi:zinc protease